MAAFRIWLVIHEPARLDDWRSVMAQSGWPVEASDLAAFARQASEALPGLALLDLAVLNPQPQARVRELKAAAPEVPLLLTYAAPIPDATLIDMFEAGIDDYLPDSTDPRLALAKLNSHLRRILPRIAQSLDVVIAPGGDIQLQRASRRLSVKGPRGKWEDCPSLTQTEAKLLALFLEHPGMIMERRFLMEAVWRGEAETVQSRTVDKHVESLRCKLGDRGARIRTVYGSGYLFKESES